MVVKNGDDSHGRIRKKSPLKNNSFGGLKHPNQKGCTHQLPLKFGCEMNAPFGMLANETSDTSENLYNILYMMYIDLLRVPPLPPSKSPPGQL